MGCIEGAVQKYYLVGSGWPGGGDLPAGLHRPMSSRGGGDVGRTGLRSLHRTDRLDDADHPRRRERCQLDAHPPHHRS